MKKYEQSLVAQVFVIFTCLDTFGQRVRKSSSLKSPELEHVAKWLIKINNSCPAEQCWDSALCLQIWWWARFVVDVKMML